MADRCRYAVVTHMHVEGDPVFRMIGCASSKAGARKIANAEWAKGTRSGIVPMLSTARSGALAGAAAKAASSPEHCRTGLSKCMKSNATVTAGGKKAAAALCMRDFNRCRR